MAIDTACWQRNQPRFYMIVHKDKGDPKGGA